MVREVTFDRKSLIIDGERKLIFSGAMHYYRLPSPELWRHRLRRMKDMGLDTVDLYFYWAYHSPREGEYDFSGFRDVDLLMDMVEEEGLYLMARPGPYICSEVDGGGFPGWLLNKDLNFRCKRDGKFEYDAEYMRSVREWYEQIVPRIARRKNLILFQIENEYHWLPTPKGVLLKSQKALQKRMGPTALLDLAMRRPIRAAMLAAQKRAMKRPDHCQSNRYFKELYEMAREMGIKVPIFHNDVEGAMHRFVDVDVVGIDDYPIKTFNVDWHNRPHVFASLDIIEEGHAAHGKDCPVLIGETQGGWFDPWGAMGHAANRRRLGPESLDITIKTCLSQGAAVISTFMACGGTTWGYVGSPDVYSSYDFSAPITEGGRPSARSKALKKVIEFARRHEREILESVPGPPLCELSPQLYCKARKAPTGSRFLYFRNCTRDAQRVKIGDKRMSVAPSAMTVVKVDERNEILDTLAPATDTAEFVFPPTEIPRLSGWRFGWARSPIDVDFDDSAWLEVPPGEKMDMDAAGVHYGFIWYRARLEKRMTSFKIDARHCWAAYLNGVLIHAHDNHKNRLGTGDDMAETVTVNVPLGLFRDAENVLTILVESLGHNKGFLEDLHQKRGIVSFKAKDAPGFRVRGGLFHDREGMTPHVDFSKVELRHEKDVKAPHQWPADRHGIGVYRTIFILDLEGPDSPPLSLDIPRSSEKALVYINGWLVGRYWGSVGPQKLFYLPAGLLNWKGENELAIALWRWEEPGLLGGVHLEMHP